MCATYPVPMAGHRIYKLAFSDLYPNYTHKAERKGRTKAEVDELICWLTGYSQEHLDELITPGNPVNLEEFFRDAPEDEPGPRGDHRLGVRRETR